MKSHKKFRRLGARIAAGLFAVAVVATGVGAGVPAYAATGNITNIGVTVVSDGTAPWDDLDGGPNPANNGIVRTNDNVKYRLNVSYGLLGNVSFTSTLPEGMEWDSSAASAVVCNGPGGGTLSNNNRTWDCNRTATAISESFDLTAWVYSAANGTTIQPSVTGGPITSQFPPVTVAAHPATEILTNITESAFVSNLINDGASGFRFTDIVALGATVVNGNTRGLEALEDTFTFKMKVPPHAVIYSASVVTGSGTLSYTQAAPGDDVIFTVTGERSDFKNAVPFLDPNFMSFARYDIAVWVPYDPTLPPGQVSTIQTQITSFDPNSVSGASNFGSGYAPGQDPAYTCPGTGNLLNNQVACFRYALDRTVPYIVNGTMVGAINSPLVMLFGDGHGYTQGYEKVVPGQSFMATVGLYNAGNANDAATGANGCTTWDNTYISVTDRPKMVIRENSNQSAFYQGNGTVQPDSSYAVEYSATPFIDDAARRAVDCGVAGDGANGWVSDPSTLPGGMASVTSLRFKSLTVPLNPGRAIGLRISFQRTTNAASLSLPVDASLPWFWQYGTTNTPTVKSTYLPGGAAADGGYVQAVPALVRSTTDWSDVSVAPGSVSTLNVHPLVIGPVGNGVDTIAKDVDVKVTFSTSCSFPIIATLEATGLDYTYTPGDPGPDGITCTADDGAPGNVVFHLHDVDAPGGSVGGTFHPTIGGHETLLDLIQFQVMQSVYTPTNTHNVATVVTSSSSDTSKDSWEGVINQAASAIQTDRTVTTDLVVTGVATFSGSKTTTTKKTGEVGPDEAFMYTISWGNGSVIPAGRGTFVDLLPYDGDARGTDGLSAAGFRVVDVSAETPNPALMGTVAIEYSTDASESIAAALALPNNANGDTGITWSTGTPPEDTKAIRVITSNDILPGYSGTATIKLKAPELARGGSLVNDFFGRTAAVAGDPTTVRDIYAASTISLSSNAGLIAGTIYRDTDFDSAVSTGDATWPAGAALVEAVDTTDNTVAATTAVKADGSYRFDPIAPGSYDIRLKSAVATGWTKIASTTAVAHADVDSGDQVENVHVLYQEDLGTSTLVDDTVKVSQGGNKVIDVTANDTLALPQFVSASKSLDGVRLPDTGGAPIYGSVELVAPTSPAVQSNIKYTAASDWPAAFANATQYEDTFDYVWTDASGSSYRATVTVTVYQKALAVNDAVTISSAGGSVNVLTNDLGDGISITGTPTSAGDVAATIDGSNLNLTSSHVWAAGESNYVTTVGYQITDSQGNTSNATVTVTVVRGPVVTGETSTVIAMNGSASFDPELLDPASVPASGIIITSAPLAGTATIAADGTISFDADGIDAGSYSFVAQFTDTRGQQVTQTYTVRVQAPPTATGGTANIGVGQSHTFAADPVTTGSIASARVSSEPSAGSATVSTDGTVVFDAAGAAAGSYTFAVEFTDNLGQTGTAEYTVVVQKAPVVAGDTSMIIGEKQKADFGSIVESAGSIKSATVTKQPSAGTVSVDASGSVSFDAGNAKPGSYTFEVSYVDNNGLTTVVTFTVIVQAAPQAVGAKITIPVGGHFTFTEQVTTTGTIVDRKITTAATSGSFELSTMDFAAGSSKPGTYTVVITYTDNVGQTATATFDVTVQAPPAGKGITVTLKSDTDRATFDPIGDTTGTKLRALTKADLSQPGHGKVALKNGLVEYVPEAGFFGTTTFTVRVTDNLGQSIVLTYTIKIVDPKVDGTNVDPTGTGRVPEPVTGGLAMTGAQEVGWLVATALLLTGLGGVLILRRRKNTEH